MGGGGGGACFWNPRGNKSSVGIVCNVSLRILRSKENFMVV